jgi:hypothetical protein
MATWSKADLEKQYERAELAGWLPQFLKSAKENQFEPEILLAVASRETNMRNIRGDMQHGVYQGYGLMQVDIKSFPDWVKSNAWKDPIESIKKGSSVLHEKRHEVANRAKAAEIELSDANLLWISLASYNHGSSGSFRSFITDGHPDEGTTGHDYGKDCLARAKVFKALLAADNMIDVEESAPVVEEDTEKDPKAFATELVEATPASPPIPGPTETVAPDQPVVTQTIAAIPPAPVSIPGQLKKIAGAFSGLSMASLLAGFGVFKDRPDLLNVVVMLVKWVLISGGAIGVVVAVVYFVERMHSAKLANDLNIARLQNTANKGVDNVDFSGWKAPAEVK